MTMGKGNGSRARIIAVANRKGGVAKTTTTVNLGAAFAERGWRVLLVDLDAQQDLCSALRVPLPRPGLGDVLLSTALYDRSAMSDAFVDRHGMTIAGGYGILEAESQLSLLGRWESTLKLALVPHLHRFDFVLLDCAPSIQGLTTNALVAADEVLIPIQTEFLAANQLPAIMSAVDDIRARLNPRLKVAGFLPTMYDGRSRHALGVIEHIALQAHLWGVRAFKPIPKAVRFAESSEAGLPISRFAPDSHLAQAYSALAADLEPYEVQAAPELLALHLPREAAMPCTA